MLTILDEPHEIKDTTNKKLAVHSGKIEFNNVCFTYADGRAVFDTLDLRIKA
jgi:ABC-type multidrug transport system fused ATPase/permease subunit